MNTHIQADIKPLISVVLCTYNGVEFLEKQMDSLFAQTYPNIEIIISDDGSTDDTRIILDKYSQLPIVTIYYQETNLGYTKNFEFALMKATGDYIAMGDQDDIWFPEKLEELLLYFPDDALLIYSNSQHIDRDGNALPFTNADFRRFYSGNDSRSLTYIPVLWGHSAMIKKQLLQHALPVPAIATHDTWLTYIAMTVSRIFYYDKVLTYYRRHDKAVTPTTSPKQVGSRSDEEKCNKYLVRLQWIESMKNNSKEHKLFFERLYALYEQRSNGRYNFELLFFLIRHHYVMYRFYKKNVVSCFIDIRKEARGVKTGT